VCKNLQKLRDEASKSDLVKETNTILQRSNNLDRQSLDAHVARKCNVNIGAFIVKLHIKNKGWGQVGAAGPKKSNQLSNPTNKQSSGERSRDTRVGGRGNASYNTARERGGG